MMLQAASNSPIPPRIPPCSPQSELKQRPLPDPCSSLQILKLIRIRRLESRNSGDRRPARCHGEPPDIRRERNRRRRRERRGILRRAQWWSPAGERERERESVRKRASMRGLGFRACVRGGERVSVRVCEVRVWHERGVCIGEGKRVYGRASGTRRTWEVHEIRVLPTRLDGYSHVSLIRAEAFIQTLSRLLHWVSSTSPELRGSFNTHWNRMFSVDWSKFLQFAQILANLG